MESRPPTVLHLLGRISFACARCLRLQARRVICSCGRNTTPLSNRVEARLSVRGQGVVGPARGAWFARAMTQSFSYGGSASNTLRELSASPAWASTAFTHGGEFPVVHERSRVCASGASYSQRRTCSRSRVVGDLRIFSPARGRPLPSCSRPSRRCSASSYCRRYYTRSSRAERPDLWRVPRSYRLDRPRCT